MKVWNWRGREQNFYLMGWYFGILQPHKLSKEDQRKIRYQFLRDFSLVPKIAEPFSHPHSPLYCPAVSFILTSFHEPHVQFTQIEIYWMSETCVRFKGTSVTGQSFPSHSSSLATYLPFVIPRKNALAYWPVAPRCWAKPRRVGWTTRGTSWTRSTSAPAATAAAGVSGIPEERDRLRRG